MVAKLNALQTMASQQSEMMQALARDVQNAGSC